MRIPSDEEMRAAVDANGVLLPDALAAPERTAAFSVFAQRSDAFIDLATWERHAAQFFETRVGLTIPKRYAGDAPLVDAARVVVAPKDMPPAVRFCFGRERTPDDFDAAMEADRRAGSPGLGLLAERCRFVWLVAAEGGESDRHALLLSAIVASVELGPILSPDGQSLFGVRTARAKLEKLGAAYR